jgi:hypothetical protein
MAVAAPATTYGFEAFWADRPPRVYFDSASVNAAEILSALPIEVADSQVDADLFWIRKNPREWFDALAPLQALNHIPEERCMVRKADLAAHLQRYGATQRGAPFSHAHFVPPTYRLSDPAEAAAFVEQLPDEDTPDNLWILKPSNLSKGRGVRVVWRFDWLRKELRRHGRVVFRYEGGEYEYVVQRYIKNVLLLDGRKSELRMYWLIASLDPLLVLMYPEGTARLTSMPFKLDDFSNPLIHITNVYQQKKHGGPDLDAELKWDFPRLQDYLSREKGAPSDFLARGLPEKLGQCLAYVVHACVETLKQTPPEGVFFGVYGADFILDDTLTPWLTEVQRGPGLSQDDAVKQRVLPAMLRGAVSIVLEVLAKKRRGDRVTELSSTHGFERVNRDH